MHSNSLKNTITLSIIDKVIELTKKKVILLEELKESLKYEQCKYELVMHSERLPVLYSLFEISTKKLLINGRRQVIDSYIKIRDLNYNLIYEAP